MQIKEVAQQLHTTARTIRYYEEKGLIHPDKDPENDYRIFSEQDVMRLTTILALREVEMPLEKIKLLLQDEKMSIGDYLNVQRAALFEKWLELHDMIQTIDEMVRQTNAGSYSIEGIHQLATHLHHLKAMRKGWEDRWHFDKQADTYDRSIKKAGHTFNIHASYDEALAMVVDEVNVRPNDIVLDIGIGTGNLGAMFLEKGATVIGVDQSDKMLATCHQKHPSIETRKGHFLALPLVDQQVDAIVSTYALHHLPDHEKLLAFQEMNRVLKSNGQICIADLMFIDEKHREKVIEKYRESGNMEAILSIEDEYFADQTLLTTWLRVNGFHVREHRFHGFLGLIYARRESGGN